MVDGYMYGLEIDPPNNYYDMVRISTNGVVDSIGRITYQGFQPTLDHPPAGPLSGARRMYELFKTIVTLSLVRQKHVLRHDDVATGIRLRGGFTSGLGIRLLARCGGSGFSFG